MRMISDFADSGTLDDLLRSRTEFFSPAELSEMFDQLAAGMTAVNEKLVHRDIKPDNILIHAGTLRIADFGLSKIVGAATRAASATSGGRDVSRLLDKALANRLAKDEETLRRQRLREETHEKNSQLKHSFDQLVREAQEIVDAFNVSAQDSRLRLHVDNVDLF